MSVTYERHPSIVRHIDGLAVISPDLFMDCLRDMPTNEKLVGALALAGCRSWDEEGRYIKDAEVALIGVGGVPFDERGLTDAEVQERIQHVVGRARTTMELSAAFSYLNSGNLEPGRLYERVVDLGHLSIAHTVTANILVAGTSVAAENEFNSQRDVVHASRLTVARTAVQERPPVLVETADKLDSARVVVEAVDQVAAAMSAPPLDASRQARMDFQERRNNLYPASKASLFMLSGSLRDYAKLVPQKDDPGKEKEYRTVLGKLQGQLGKLWPELFE